MFRFPAVLPRMPLCALALLMACGEDTGEPKGDDTGLTPVVIDEDRDGWPEDEDCDDQQAQVNPGQAEVCDGVDNNCDGEVDEGVLLTFYADADGDGFGDVDSPVAACDPSDGVVADSTDCDDGDATVNMASSEICDEVDNNCNGVVDEGMDVGPWYRDMDGDGYGIEEDVTAGCGVPSGYVGLAGDCDDMEPASYPGNTEVCDGVDNDCDGASDEADATDAVEWYQDADADGFGNSDISSRSCTQPVGYTTVGEDCDDTNANAYPGATEVCDDDDVDEDCNGLADSEDPATDLSSMMLFYTDSDGDRYGDANAVGTLACDGASGTVSNNLDCDDSDLLTNPAVLELCDGEDDNCNGLVDDSPVDGDKWYLDDDGDGYGVYGDTVVSCTAVSGYASQAGDCDDSDPAISPEAGCAVDTGDTGLVGEDWSGTYLGGGILTVDLLGVPDTCVFTDLRLIVDEAVTPQIIGSASCTFSGFFSLFGAQTASLDGNLISTDEVSGNVAVGTYVADPWSGSLSGNTLEGSFAGSGTWSGLAITYSCEFSADR